MIKKDPIVIPFEQQIQMMVKLYKMRYTSKDINDQIQSKLKSTHYLLGERFNNNVLISQYILKNISKFLQENTLARFDNNRLVFETERYLDNINGTEWDQLILEAISICAHDDYTNQLKE